jgi:ankyrin repeat protein
MAAAMGGEPWEWDGEEAMAGEPEMVRLLLARGAGVDACDRSKRTALHYAAQVGADECVALLLEAGAKRDVRDKRGATPADLAKEAGHDEVVKALG